MTNIDREQKTINYYDTNAEDWALKHGGDESESYWRKEIDRFHQLLPSGKILEIGSGPGKDAAALIQKGYIYTGTDASEGLIVIAKKRNLDGAFEKVDVYNLDFPEQSFDGFWTAATLLHIPKYRIDEALKQIKTQVKPNGVGFISLKEGRGEKEEKNTGRWFSYYSKEEFAEILERNGYGITDFISKVGEKDIWLCFWVTV